MTIRFRIACFVFHEASRRVTHPRESVYRHTPPNASELRSLIRRAAQTVTAELCAKCHTDSVSQCGDSFGAVTAPSRTFWRAAPRSPTPYWGADGRKRSSRDLVLLYFCFVVPLIVWWLPWTAWVEHVGTYTCCTKPPQLKHIFSFQTKHKCRDVTMQHVPDKTIFQTYAHARNVASHGDKVNPEHWCRHQVAKPSTTCKNTKTFKCWSQSNTSHDIYTAYCTGVLTSGVTVSSAVGCAFCATGSQRQGTQ